MAKHTCKHHPPTDPRMLGISKRWQGWMSVLFGPYAPLLRVLHLSAQPKTFPTQGLLRPGSAGIYVQPDNFLSEKIGTLRGEMTYPNTLRTGPGAQASVLSLVSLDCTVFQQPVIHVN